jgi:hypothetical protein
MKIQIFNNGKGLIHGTDPKRIGCDIAGTLSIGAVEISISPEDESILPVLFNGCSSEYKATFTSAIGIKYELGKVTIRGGRIVPPSQTAVELMELRCRADALEAECEALKNQIRELSNIFDTNSLNFLIN